MGNRQDTASEEKRRVDVCLEYPAELSAVCPVCGKAAPLYDKREARVLTDTDGRRVLDVVENRDKEAVKGVFKCLDCEQHGL